MRCNFLSAPPMLGAELSRLCTANLLSGQRKGFNTPACLWSAIPPLNTRPDFFCHFSTMAALRKKNICSAGNRFAVMFSSGFQELVPTQPSF